MQPKSTVFQADCKIMAAGTYTAELKGNGKTLSRKTVMGILSAQAASPPKAGVPLDPFSWLMPGAGSTA